ncbi:MAG: hypothetical protein WCH99_17655 [Verrucomicrobiota bacterium]
MNSQLNRAAVTSMRGRICAHESGVALRFPPQSKMRSSGGSIQRLGMRRTSGVLPAADQTVSM